MIREFRCRGSVDGVPRGGAESAARHATPTRMESAERRTWRRHGTSMSALRIVAGAGSSQTKRCGIRSTGTRSARSIGAEPRIEVRLGSGERESRDELRKDERHRDGGLLLHTRRLVRRHVDGAVTLAAPLDTLLRSGRVVLTRAAGSTLDRRAARAHVARHELARTQRHAHTGRQEPTGYEEQEEEPVREHRGEGYGRCPCRWRSFLL